MSMRALTSRMLGLMAGLAAWTVVALPAGATPTELVV
jgi:hypothetical protein